MSIKFLVLGGGVFWVGGGGSADFIFMGAGIFLNVSFALFFGILRGPGREIGHSWYGTFAKPKGHFTEGMFEKC